MSSHHGGSHYASSHYLSSHYGRTAVVPPTEVHPPGMGPEGRLRHKRILQEDEIIMALIVAFLDMKDK